MTPDLPPPEAAQPPASPGLPPAMPPVAAPPVYGPPYGYPYWLPPVPVQREYPVPEGRNVPKIWLATLVVLTVAAVAMALGGALSIEVAPSPFHTTLYQNTLANQDGSWLLRDNASESCSYANGGLDARDNSVDLLASPCRLTGSDASDLRLSVRILPQAQLDFPLRPAIFVHSSVAFLFSPDTGSFAVYAPTSGNSVSTTAPVSTSLVYSGTTDQWFTDGLLSNTIIVQVQNGIYTLAVNGAQVYSGDFNGAAESLPTTGSIGLGAWLSDTDASATGEAAYADFTLTAP